MEMEYIESGIPLLKNKKICSRPVIEVNRPSG